jgi:O-6-methylguanine DNA methyltransferase
MRAEQLKAFKLVSRIGPVYGAIAERGLIALCLPTRSRSDFLARVERLAPGADLNWVEPGETEAGRQLRQYLQGRRREFDAPLDLRGVSQFTAGVLRETAAIAYGRTATYGEIASRTGRPRAARAVGRAVGANPIPIFIPCHRVMGAGGKLTGFGSGLETKQALLDLEQAGKPLI